MKKRDCGKSAKRQQSNFPGFPNTLMKSAKDRELLIKSSETSQITIDNVTMFFAKLKK